MVQYKGPNSGKLAHGALLKEWTIDFNLSGSWGSSVRDTEISGSGNKDFTFNVKSGSTGGITVYEAFAKVVVAPSGTNDVYAISASLLTGDNTALLNTQVLTSATTEETVFGKLGGTSSIDLPVFLDGTGGKVKVRLEAVQSDDSAADLADFDAGRLVFKIRGTESEE